MDLSNLEHVLWFALAGLLGGFVRGFTGFGGPAIILLLLSHVFPPSTLVFKVVLIDAMANVHLIPTAIKDVNWRTTLLLAVPSVLMLPIGMYLLHHLEGDVMRRSIGVVTALATLWLLSGYRIRSQIPWVLTALMGLINGVIYGASCLILIAVAFLLAGPEAVRASRANIIAWTFIMVLAYIPLYLLSGYPGETEWLPLLFLGFTYGLSAYAGSHLFRTSGQLKYRRLALGLLVLLSGVAIVG